MNKIYINFKLFVVLIIITFTSVILSLLLFHKLQNIRLKLADILEVLNDIEKGNTDRKILAKPKDMTSLICYKINDIVYAFKKQIVKFKKADKTNKQLMTNLSHDIRTPLTTLIGYLDAAQKGIVVGKEREEYIEIARMKAHDMKDYVNTLFEWFKLNSDEETFIIKKVDLGELTRNCLKNWIAIFEDNSLDFDIDIPEKQIEVNLDTDAYSRILNNLIQNVLLHSEATCIKISISLHNNNAKIIVSDNGKGISKEDLPHIFERLYKCDKGRSKKGSGLGLSIVKQLVKKNNGIIEVKSEQFKETKFIMQLPLVKTNHSS